MRNILTLGLGIFVLAACATDFRAIHLYNEIMVVNESSSMIQDLTVRVSDTGRKFNCANIAPKGFCSNRFKPRRYEYQPIEIEWTFDGRTRKTESFVVDVSPNLPMGRILRGVIKVRPGGEISAGFVEFRPNRGQDSDRD